MADLNSTHDVSLSTRSPSHIVSIAWDVHGFVPSVPLSYDKIRAAEYPSAYQQVYISLGISTSSNLEFRVCIDKEPGYIPNLLLKKITVRYSFTSKAIMESISHSTPMLVPSWNDKTKLELFLGTCEDVRDNSNIYCRFEVHFVKLASTISDIPLDQSPCNYAGKINHIELGRHLLDLQKQDLFTDLELKALDGSQVIVHKVVMSCVSHVFERMMCTEMKEKTTNSISLPISCMDAMLLLVNIVYTLEVPEKASMSYVLECFSVFHMYSMTEQIKACTLHLCKLLNKDNCLEMLCATTGTDSDLEKGSILQCKKSFSELPLTDYWKEFKKREDFPMVMEMLMDDNTSDT